MYQRSLGALQPARRLWETNLIDHNIELNKSRDHPHKAVALPTDIDSIIGNANTTDQELLALDNGFLSTQQYNVKP